MLVECAVQVQGLCIRVCVCVWSGEGGKGGNISMIGPQAHCCIGMTKPEPVQVWQRPIAKVDTATPTANTHTDPPPHANTAAPKRSTHSDEGGCHVLGCVLQDALCVAEGDIEPLHEVYGCLHEQVACGVDVLCRQQLHVCARQRQVLEPALLLLLLVLECCGHACVGVEQASDLNVGGRHARLESNQLSSLLWAFEVPRVGGVVVVLCVISAPPLVTRPSVKAPGSYV